MQLSFSFASTNSKERICYSRSKFFHKKLYLSFKEFRPQKAKKKRKKNEKKKKKKKKRIGHDVTKMFLPYKDDNLRHSSEVFKRVVSGYPDLNMLN